MALTRLDATSTLSAATLADSVQQPADDESSTAFTLQDEQSAPLTTDAQTDEQPDEDDADATERDSAAASDLAQDDWSSMRAFFALASDASLTAAPRWRPP